MSQAQGKPDLDLDEDLFDFAAVRREPDPVESEEDLEQIFASFRDDGQEEDLLAVPQAPSAPTSAAPTSTAPTLAAERAPGTTPDAVHDRAPRPAVNTAPESPTAARRTPASEPAARAPEATVEHIPAARSSRLSKGVVAVAAAVTLLNSVVAVVALRGRSSDHDVRAVAPEGAPEAVAHEPAAHAASTHAPSVAGSGLPEPERVGIVPDHPALDEARRQISHGEYGAARQRVYGLLSIIDRLEDPRRGALEADCQFLIAQSLHLEALARMGGAE